MNRRVLTTGFVSGLVFLSGSLHAENFFFQDDGRGSGGMSVERAVEEIKNEKAGEGQGLQLERGRPQDDAPGPAMNLTSTLAGAVESKGGPRELISFSKAAATVATSILGLKSGDFEPTNNGIRLNDAAKTELTVKVQATTNGGFVVKVSPIKDGPVPVPNTDWVSPATSILFPGAQGTPREATIIVEKPTNRNVGVTANIHYLPAGHTWVPQSQGAKVKPPSELPSGTQTIPFMEQKDNFLIPRRMKPPEIPKIT